MLIRAAALACALLAAACALSRKIDIQVYRDYHASRFAAVAQACLDRGAETGWPQSPPTPLLCATQIEPAYRAVVAAVGEEAAATEELLQHAGACVAHLDELVQALAAKDGPRVARLGPRTVALEQELQLSQRRQEAAADGVQHALDALRQAWSSVWPGQDLDFDLSAALARAEAARPQPDELAAGQLKHYYEATYARLAMAYLGYQPPAEPDPEPPLPPGGATLAARMAGYEAALRARYDLDRAIESETTQMQALAGAHLAPAEWQAGAPLDDEKVKGRAAVSLARLKLLKLADGLLSQCLRAYAREAAWQWRQVWPGMSLETDVLAYAAARGAQSMAGSKPAPAPPSASPAPAAELEHWREMTFRQ